MIWVQLLRDVQAGVKQLDRGNYSEYGEGSCEEFLADIQAEEQSRFPQAKNSDPQFS
jgi:hypothetical protein